MLWLNALALQHMIVRYYLGGGGGGGAGYNVHACTCARPHSTSPSLLCLGTALLFACSLALPHIYLILFGTLVCVVR